MTTVPYAVLGQGLACRSPPAVALGVVPIAIGGAGGMLLVRRLRRASGQTARGDRDGHLSQPLQRMASIRPLRASPSQCASGLDHPLEVTRPARTLPSIATAMPVAVHITPHNMSREDYDRVIAELDAAGAGEPEGRLFHAAYGGDEVHMFEVWESPDHFDAHSDRLFAVIQGAGLDAGTVNVHPLHSPHPD